MPDYCYRCGAQAVEEHFTADGEALSIFVCEVCGMVTGPADDDRGEEMEA